MKRKLCHRKFWHTNSSWINYYIVFRFVRFIREYTWILTKLTLFSQRENEADLCRRSSHSFSLHARADETDETDRTNRTNKVPKVFNDPKDPDFFVKSSREYFPSINYYLLTIIS